MRTTLTIDDDVAAEIEALRQARRVSLKAVVNDALRRGLAEMGKARKQSRTLPDQVIRCRQGPLADRQCGRSTGDSRGRGLFVILVDANILVCAPTYPQHERARRWLDGRLSGDSRIGLPWPSLLAFLRLVTNPRIYERPLSMTAPVAQVAAWLACEPVWIPMPTERHAGILARLLSDTGATGNLVPDAHLAALAIEHGLELASNDSDFARFPGLRWSNPLAA